MRPMSCASLVTLATLATAIPFDAKTQRISTSGVHKFMPPDWSAGHVRGPCPALNALSNHGHMSRDGVVHWAEWARATNEVYGLGRELAFFLAVYGVFVAGNGTHCSIGGATPLIDTSILGPLGLPPGGLTGSHNNYEGDASPCRCDLYKCGEAHRLHVDLFTALYDLRGYKGYLTYDDIVTHRIARRKDSENTNGYFTAAVIAPIAATGAFSFIQLFGNHSEEYPDGWLDGYNLKTFFGVEGERGNFTYTEGYERIPDNWYRRSRLDEYDFSRFFMDSHRANSRYLGFLNVGSNTGTPCSFVGLNFEDLAGGVLNARTLTEDNNAACFFFRTLQALPSSAQEMMVLLTGRTLDAVALTTHAANISNTLKCPQLEHFDPDAWIREYDQHQ